MIIVPRNYKILLCVIAWRLLSVFLVQTAHVPDEYWQSLEVAHRLAFGYGYLTWEWREGIRSYIYPGLLSVVYRALKTFNLDHVTMLTTVPRILQALLSAYADYRFYIWTRNKWALFSLCINWYWYYCASRTLLNTLETSLTTIALSMFPWRDTHINSINYFWIVAVLCVMRPTAVIIWAPLILYHFCTSTKSKISLIFDYTIISLTSVIFSIFVDTICYGEFVITPLRFLYANVIYQVGDFYGKEHPFWYLTSGIPVLLGLEYVMFLIAVWQIIYNTRGLHRQTVLLVVIMWTIIVYSMITHKEFRFILPLISLFIHLSSQSVCQLMRRITPLQRKIFTVVFILSNVIPGVYFCLIHQRGSLDIMKTLQREAFRSKSNDLNILFLTPCHATPLYSHLHKNITAKFLTCEPRIKQYEMYENEGERFLQNPALWLDEKYTSHDKMPSHVILFDKLRSRISRFLDHFILIDTKFYSSFPESDYGNELCVFKKKRSKIVTAG